MDIYSQEKKKKKKEKPFPERLVPGRALFMVPP